MRITATVENEIGLDRSFSRFTSQLTDLRQIWPAVIIELRAIVREQYAGQGVGPSGRWQPLSPAYAKWKAKHFPGLPILQRTGLTLLSLTGNTSDTVIQQTETTLVFGTRRRGQVFHQRGSGRLPRRKVFDLNEAQKTRIMKAIQKRLLSATQAGVSLK